MKTQPQTTPTKPKQALGELIVFIPDKATEYCAVLDKGDRELIYLGKDKEKAQRIATSINEYDSLKKKEEMSNELVGIISKLNNNIQSGRWSIRSANPNDGQILFDLWKNVQQFIKKEN